jgi:hypothetical protein
MPKVSFDQYLFARSRWVAVIAVFAFVVAMAGVAGAGSTSPMESVLTSSGQFDNEPNTNLARVRPYSYITVAGVAFTPGDNFFITNMGGGCIRASAPGAVQTRLDLPQDAIIMQIDLYYYDASVELNITGNLFSYDVLNGGAYTALATLTSTGSAGIGVLSSPILNVTVDNVNNSYVLSATLPNTGAVQLCGMRVAYYPPPSLTIQ